MNGLLDVADPDTHSRNLDFVSHAVGNELLPPHHAETILQHTQRYGVDAADAALQLSLLLPHEVEALQLLCDPTSCFSGYELSKLIGCGAAGMVFRARQVALDRDVAIKTINPHSRTAQTTGEPRIQREAHAIARLRHPGIVAAIDSGFHHGRFCIVMELVEGETLVDFIARNKPLSESVAWHIVRQVAHALSYAAANGIVHRDIKPANLLLCEPPAGTGLPEGVPWVKVADFGLASDHGSNQITATGATLGSPAYVAPEQLSDSHVNVQADIYSLGATLFHMFNGHPPCTGQSPLTTIMRKSIGDQQWRDELDTRVSEASRTLFHEMTQSSPSERIADHALLVDRIDRVLKQLDGVEVSGSNTRHNPTRQRGTTDPEIVLADASGYEEPIADARPSSVNAIPQAAHEHADSHSNRHSFGLTLTVGLATAVVFATVAWKLKQRFQPEEIASKLPTTDWVVDGFPQPLFNGSSVPFLRKSGAWSVGSVSDGSRVLVADEGSQMTVPLTTLDGNSSDVRLRFATNLPPGSEAEVRFRMDAPGVKEPDVVIGTLHLTANEARFQSSTPTQDRPSDAISLSSSESESSVFHQVVVFRRQGEITVAVEGQSLGTMKVPDHVTASLELVSRSGRLHFADVDVIALKPFPSLPN
ncbi:MAG: serine/threonine-protein kinase [Planctomycetota bacterium]